MTRAALAGEREQRAVSAMTVFSGVAKWTGPPGTSELGSAASAAPAVSTCTGRRPTCRAGRATSSSSWWRAPGCTATAARPSRWRASCAQWRRVAAGWHGDPRFELFELPPDYGAGRETALVAALNGGPAQPTFTPPLPFARRARVPHAGPERRDARSACVDRAPRRRLVSRARDRRDPGSAPVTVSRRPSPRRVCMRSSTACRCRAWST